MAAVDRRPTRISNAVYCSALFERPGAIRQAVGAQLALRYCALKHFNPAPHQASTYDVFFASEIWRILDEPDISGLKYGNNPLHGE